MSEIPLHSDGVWEMAITQRLAEFARRPSERTMLAFLDLPTLALPHKYGKKRVFEKHIYSIIGEGEWQDAAPAAANRQLDEQKRRKIRVEHLCRLGAFSRAFRTLHSSGIHQVSDSLIAKVRELFPEGDVMAELETERPVFNAQEVMEAIWRLPRGAAPGPTGWTRELLFPVMENEELAAMLARLLTGIDASTADLLTADVVPLKKPDDGVRPIVLQEVMVKLIGGMCLRRCRETVAGQLGPNQFGLKGAEAAIHHVRELWERDTSCGIITVDCSNAYGSLKRENVAHALQHLHDVAPLKHAANLELGSASDVRIQGRRVGKMTSGLRQGSAVAPALFCLATGPIIRRMNEKHPLVSVTAYLDDYINK